MDGCGNGGGPGLPDYTDGGDPLNDAPEAPELGAEGAPVTDLGAYRAERVAAELGKRDRHNWAILILIAAALVAAYYWAKRA